METLEIQIRRDILSEKMKWKVLAIILFGLMGAVVGLIISFIFKGLYSSHLNVVVSSNDLIFIAIITGVIGFVWFGILGYGIGSVVIVQLFPKVLHLVSSTELKAKARKRLSDLEKKKTDDSLYYKNQIAELETERDKAEKSTDDEIAKLKLIV